MFSFLTPSFIMNMISGMSSAQLALAIRSLPPTVIQSFLSSITPVEAKQIAAAITPEVAKAIASIITPEFAKTIATSLPTASLNALFSSSSIEALKSIAAALSPETLKTIVAAVTPEVASIFASNLSPENAATVSNFLQYLTGVDMASFATSKVALNIDLGSGNILSISGDVMGAFTKEINILTGSNFNDVLTGDGTAESINGGAGNDTLGGSVGNDTLNGGDGVDTASYGKSDFAVTVNLTTGTGQGGTANGDKLFSIENVTGSNYNDVLVGSVGSNVLFAGAGNDKVSAGAGNDTVEGGAGNDTIDGGAGADQMNGGDGIDTVSYASATTGVNANLLLGYGLNGDATGDKYVGIENLVGSKFNDTLIGNDGNNVLLGGDGADLLIGGKGADSIDGGAGIDTASYATSSKAVNANLSGFRPVSGTLVVNGKGGDAEGDVLANIERLFGSALNDTLVGNSAANTIEGGSGNDYIDGAAGNDFLVGGSGTDTFHFQTGSGKDIVSDFNAKADVLDFTSAKNADFGSFSALMSHASQVGNSVVFSFGQESLTLNNVKLAALNANNVQTHLTPEIADVPQPLPATWAFI